ncbi:MAG: DUF975 family protein [Candidatus Cloacimonetes bacterium]|nr:DUF975 family protein [Candidatus Cloacimonadota bacterium]MDD3532590.1 DUF975 family protein [Candidatus Cloacimonadota bacterium]
MNSAQIRAEARRLMGLQMGMLILVLLIYSVMMSAASSILNIGSLLIYGPLSLGLAKVLLSVLKEEKIDVEMLFSGFQDFSRSLVAGLLIGIYVLLWSLLLIVPGIIAAFSYSMTFFIMEENPQLSAQEAIEASKHMIYGHKLRLFDLWLSFIGWFILCLFSFGVALIYVAPYFHTALAVFYADLKQAQLNPAL